MAKNSSSHERAVKGYLTPKNDSLFKGFITAEKIRCSEAMNLIISEYFQKIPAEKKLDYIKASRGKNSY